MDLEGWQDEEKDKGMDRWADGWIWMDIFKATPITD